MIQGRENDNTDTGDGSSDDGSSDRFQTIRLTIQGMILPIRLIIPAMTIPVTSTDGSLDNSDTWEDNGEEVQQIEHMGRQRTQEASRR